MTRPARRLPLLSLLLAASLIGTSAFDFPALFSASVANAQSETPKTPAAVLEKRITSASGVNFRMAPAPSAEALARLPIGTVVEVLERATVDLPKPGTVWARARLSDGKEGWLVQSFTLSYSPEAHLSVSKEILKARLSAPDNVSFQDWADLLNFVEASIKGTSGADAADLEMARFHVLSLAAGAVPLEKAGEEPYGSWLRKNAADVVHNEPAGVFIVRADRIWELEARYHSLPQGETIAWMAAETALPGECEGYLPCYLAACRMSEGTYLERYPNGAHAAEALKRIGAVVSTGLSEIQLPLDADTCSELKTELGQLKKQVSRSTQSSKSKVVSQIDSLASKCGPKK